MNARYIHVTPSGKANPSGSVVRDVQPAKVCIMPVAVRGSAKLSGSVRFTHPSKAPAPPSSVREPSFVHLSLPRGSNRTPRRKALRVAMALTSLMSRDTNTRGTVPS